MHYGICEWCIDNSHLMTKEDKEEMEKQHP